MPSRWLVRLQGPSGPQFPVEAAHAVVSRWLDTDHKAPVKAYSAAPVVTKDGATGLEVRLLDDGLAPRLAAAAALGMPVRLGRHQFNVSDGPQKVEMATWPDLAAARGDRAWVLRFTTPTTFRRGSRSSPWPSPEAVLRGLLARWRALDSTTAPCLTGEAMRSVWVSDLAGHSVAAKRAGLVVSGFVGRVRYVCDDLPAYAASVGALLRFASYAGAGSHTAFGFGVVRLERTWQPGRTARDDRMPEAVLDVVGG